MNKHFKWICLLCVISLLFCSTVSPSSAQQDTVSLIPDGKGNFYWLETDSGYFSVDLITNGTHSRRLIREKQSVNGGIINGSDLITYGVVYGQVCLNIINEQSSRSVMLEESAILSNGITAAGDQYIYLINPNNDHEIHVYRRWNRSDHTLSFSQPVHALFTDQTSHRPYGITTGGILDLESGTFVSCTTPTLPLHQNDGYYTDSKGQLFTFRPDTGFTRLSVFSGSEVYYCNGAVYCLSEQGVIRCTTDGIPEAVYTPSQPVTELSASGNNLLLLHDTMFEKVSSHSFLKLNTDPSETSTERSSPASQSTPSVISQSSTGQTSTASVVQEADTVLDFRSLQQDGKLLRGIPQGTTIAVLKKSMIYDGYTLTVRDHHRKVITSGIIGTGFELEFQSSADTRSFYTVIIGDVTGEGQQNTNDVRTLMRYFCGEEDLSEAARAAADLNQDQQTDIRDLLYCHCCLNRESG